MGSFPDEPEKDAEDSYQNATLKELAQQQHEIGVQLFRLTDLASRQPTANLLSGFLWLLFITSVFLAGTHFNWGWQVYAGCLLPGGLLMVILGELLYRTAMYFVRRNAIAGLEKDVIRFTEEERIARDALLKAEPGRRAAYTILIETHERAVLRRSNCESELVKLRSRNNPSTPSKLTSRR